MAAKVPEIGAMFWIIKILTTGVGEAGSDYLANLSLLLAAAVGVGGFVAALCWQLRTRHYTAIRYWSAVLMVAVFGTMVADGPHVALQVPYAAMTLLYALALGVIFWCWHRSEGTLSIHSITSTRREIFYWATVLATFALGTAAGDLVATSLRLGFLAAGVLFAAAIAIPALAWWRFGLNEVIAFWLAYVITRPLGASFADWFGKPHSFGRGLGWGDGTVAGVGLVAIIALVGYVAATRSDVQKPLITNGPNRAGKHHKMAGNGA